MRAVVASEPGGPEVLRVQEVTDPEPGPHEVLLAVAATAVNRADLLQREGHYPPPPGAPTWLGMEVSGTVAAVGREVSGWGIGDTACALLSGGGYAQLATVPAAHLLPVPAGVDLVDAAALPEVTCTVWSNVFMLAALRPGEVLLVHGGSSGVGTMAIQLAKQVGARVAVTARTDAKLRACAGLGAEILINYHEQDFVEVLKAATDGHGADVVLDNMGAYYFARNLDALAVNGRLVVIGLQGGRRAELDLSAIMAKRAAVLATTLRARPDAEKAAIIASVREHVWPLLADGSVRPVVHARLPLDQAPLAHRMVEESDHVGKVLLTL
jgi:putative PIG3 family NAD(P)H quinone oxidoreductase